MQRSTHIPGPIAINFGKEMRQILHAASKNSELYAYVNYAHGDESLENLWLRRVAVAASIEFKESV